MDKYTPNSFEDVRPGAKEAPKGFIDYKTTESFVGFIVYVAQTFTCLAPYLKGIYLTLNSYRGGRDAEGWLNPEAKLAVRLGVKEPDGDPPQFVHRVPRFVIDLQALVELTALDTPLDIPMRGLNNKAVYIVGDASG